MPGPDQKPQRSRSAKLTLLVVGLVALAYIATIVVGLMRGQGRF